MGATKLSDFEFNVAALRRYEIALKSGATICTDGSAEDHARAMEMLAQLERVGMIDPEDRTFRPAAPAAINHAHPVDPAVPEERPLRVAADLADSTPQSPTAAAFAAPAAFANAAAPTAKSEPLPSAFNKWLANCAGKNGERTVDAKAYHIKDFLARSFGGVESVERWLAEHQKTGFLKNKGLRALEANKAAGRHSGPDIEVGAIGKRTLVEYKPPLLAVPQTPKTIDNKLNTLHDFFKYLIGHELRGAAESNPVEGMFIQNKRSRKKTTKSYQPFTPEALAILFEPAAYLAAMDAPDLFWGPLLGIHTGMRIGEATQIRCADVHKAPDTGLDYIHVHKSKTPGGIRNVPISDALIRLGFLDYVEECRAAGAERLFPHRALINHSYSKELSATLLAHQRRLGIKAPQTSFHSFRVNVITQMHNNDSNTAKVMKIVGHGDGGGHAVHWGYVRDLPDCKKIVDKLEWPISAQGLRYDGRFAGFLADRKNWADN